MDALSRGFYCEDAERPNQDAGGYFLIYLSAAPTLCLRPFFE
jgi:hypothetical protein